jgi:hypothetical protein
MNAPDMNIIDQLAAAVALRITPSIPIEIDLWGSAEIGAYLKCGARQVIDRYAPLPDFPKAIRLPTSSGGQGQPRWHAVEVIAWATKYKEGNRPGRPRLVS